uniref:Prolyl 4-hydroxylase alpha subunit domain-containing protein n=1 Tax=Zooxanthella nutricula TaxID=1333877 RepID=A0A7S2N8R8_9DINO
MAAIFSSLNPPVDEVGALAAVMPELAGRPLEPPAFFRTGWRMGQRFGAEDDPDRTREAWLPPEGFFGQDTAAAQRAMAVSEELPVRCAKGSFARVVRRVFTEEACAALLASVNAKGFTPALLNIGGGVQELRPEVRDGHRVIVDSPELAAWLLDVLRPHLPQEFGGGPLMGLNERLRFLCYTPGQAFEPHYDGCYRRPQGHPRVGDRSLVTVQVYLHDVPTGFGGATTFDPNRSYSLACQPEMGTVLVFSQDLFHEGSEVTGGLKYTLRTEAMYEPPDPRRKR